MTTARRITYTAMCIAWMAVCAWLTVPGPVPFTLQTFAVFLSVALLGGKRGSLAVALYLLLGAFGLPIFSGFRGGFGALLGATGGYLIGFFVAALVMWALERPFGRSTRGLAGSMVLGQLFCYAFGTAWYYFLYAGGNSLAAILATCVLPFLLTDGTKLALALLVYSRLRTRIRLE